MKIGKLKVKFFMTSGNVVVLKCKSFEISRLSGTHNRNLSITGADRIWSIDIDKIEAVTSKWCLF